jgi:Translocon-associated protein beta (TRAPB)
MLGPCWKKSALWRAGWLAAVAAGCVGAAACGSGDPKGQSAATSVKSHKVKSAGAPGKPGETSLGDMVAAVSASKGPPVELKFSMPVRPEVGQAAEIDVAVIPSQPLPDSVSVSFQVVDGLDIVDGSQMERVEKLTAGTPIHHVLKVLPKRDGIFALTAVVSYTASNQEMNRMFSIPVIAGVGLTDQVAKGP